LRGAGKSTIGPMLAQAMDMPFSELNTVIAQQAGMPVDEVIALYGQEGYRSLEREALETIVVENDQLVLAVAGGIVSETNTYDFLLNHFHSIWLRALPQEHMDRVRAQGDERPMAGNPRAMQELKSILTSREAHYQRADGQVMTSGKLPAETLATVLDVVSGFQLG
jgi:XRE family aerobic/anaerobic benzoate catabolism transcriptional regulator